MRLHMRCLVLRTSENSVTAKFTECGFSTLGPSFFDGTAPAETWAHRSDGQCQRIHLRPAHTCSAPRQGTRLCTGSSTAALLLPSFRWSELGILPFYCFCR